MLREYEAELIKRYKKYYSLCLIYERGIEANYTGHANEISWILHTLYGYTDKEIIDIEEEVKIYVSSYN